MLSSGGRVISKIVKKFTNEKNYYFCLFFFVIYFCLFFFIFAK